jgi:hypothetical protein
LVGYLGFGALLGEQNGSFSRDALVVLGNLIWTVLFTPIFLPALEKVRDYALSEKERI